MEKPDIVEVVWMDSSSTHGWHKKQDLAELCECVSVGFLLKEGGEYVLLAETLALDGDDGRHEYGCSSAIPRSTIRKITKLSRGRSKR